MDWVCHGKCLVKIKCPASVIGLKPDINNYKQLEYKNGAVRLMKTSEYYYFKDKRVPQTENEPIFAFTIEGYHLGWIEFDNEFWSDRLLHLDYFWSNFFVKLKFCW